MSEIGSSAQFRTTGQLERFASFVRSPVSRLPWFGAIQRAYEWLLERVAADRLVCRFPHGETIRVRAAYRHISWNPLEYAAFREDVRPGDVVFDLGANLGAYSMLFAQWVGERGRVVAFEPSTAARTGLEAHAVVNGVAGRIIVRPEAVGSCSGRGRFLGSGAAGENRCVSSAGEGTEVPITSIDDVCRTLGVRPALIKVDVEGAELDVLRGARRTIAACGPALKLYVEMHPRLWPALGISRDEVEAELAFQRLSPERLDGGSDLWGIEGVCLRLRPCAS